MTAGFAITVNTTFINSGNFVAYSEHSLFRVHSSSACCLALPRGVAYDSVLDQIGCEPTKAQVHRVPIFRVRSYEVYKKPVHYRL